MSVQVSTDFGIILRKTSLKIRQVSRTKVFEIMEVDKPHDEDDKLLSFGPHFGEEAARELINRLQKAGLVYFEDFFDFTEAAPQWCKLTASAEE
jgi:hypothetical protein